LQLATILTLIKNASSETSGLGELTARQYKMPFKEAFF